MKLIANDHESRLYEMDAFGLICVNKGTVNLEDLFHAVPGAIIRVDGNPNDSIKFISPFDAPALGCIAGWISEEDQ